MLYTKSQCHWPMVPEKNIFKGFLPYMGIGLLVPEKKLFKGYLPNMGMAAILVMWLLTFVIYLLSLNKGVFL